MMWKRSSLYMLHHDQHPLIIAHRGDSRNVPENTMISFEDAYRLGVDCLETDVHITRDGEFVLFHDPIIDRTTNGTGPIAQYTLAQLRKMDAGYWFPHELNHETLNNEFPFRGKGLQILTIDEVLPRFPNVRFNLDIKSKTPSAPELLARKLHVLGVENRVMVGSFHQKQIIKFRQYSNAPTSASPIEVLQLWWKARNWIRFHKNSLYSGTKLSQRLIMGKILPYQALQIPEQQKKLVLLTPKFINFVHALDIAVHVWTINDQKDMERLLEWGVDGIFTDTPQILQKIIQKKFPEK